MKDNDQESSEEQPDRYYLNPNIDYYEPKSYNEPDDQPQAHYIQLTNYTCHLCNSSFKSNNQLHHHLCGKGMCRPYPSVSDYLVKELAQKAKPESCFEEAEADMNLATPVLIPSTSTSQLDVGTGYEF